MCELPAFIFLKIDDLPFHGVVNAGPEPSVLDTAIAVRDTVARLIADCIRASCTRGSRPVLHPL